MGLTVTHVIKNITNLIHINEHVSMQVLQYNRITSLSVPYK